VDLRDALRDSRVGSLRNVHRRGLEAAVVRLEEELEGEREPETCGYPVRSGRWAGQRCRNPAGLKTPNQGDGPGGTGGVGPCFAHGGCKARGRAEAAWVMAHRFAQELDVTPWEGLLKAVRIAAGKVAYTEWVIGQAKDDLELEDRFGRSDDGLLVHPDTGEPLGVGQVRRLGWWVSKNELWVDRLARYSKAAIDAGVAEALVRAEQQHAEQVAGVLNAVLAALEGDLSEDQVARARGIMRRELLALADTESGGTGQVIEGTTVEEKS
jgi:hypothetical protein